MEKREIIIECERDVKRLIADKRRFLKSYEMKKIEGFLSEETYQLIKNEIEAEIRGLRTSLLLCTNVINTKIIK